MTDLLNMYRERSGDPSFWAEPVNALTNASFLAAAGGALYLAQQRHVSTPATWLLIAIAAAIGVGSFLFHTAASSLTLWLDVGPIALFQSVFLWLCCRQMLRLNLLGSGLSVIVVVGSSFALMPIRQPLNGSLFYVPSLLGLVVLGVRLAWRGGNESHVLLLAAGWFAVSVVARSLDWVVPWSLGTHFLWHLLNGVVVYLLLRAWIIFCEPGRASVPQ